jgi:hypothetical protein
VYSISEDDHPGHRGHRAPAPPLQNLHVLHGRAALGMGPVNVAE